MSSRRTQPSRLREVTTETTGSSSGRVRRAVGLSAATITLGATLAACGGDSGSTALTWYTNPDSGGQATIAEKCTKEANGKYSIETSGLPSDATAQREQLIRRLAGSDESVDLMSLDPPFVPEFASAGFLYDIPQDRVQQYTEGIVESAVRSAEWEGKLVVVPFWANTQLLWYRKSVAEEAGLNMDQAVTWDQLVKAADEQGKTVAVQANRYEGYTVWINALVESAGGEVIQNPEASPEDLKLGLDTTAGKDAAAVIDQVATVGGPAMSTMDEEAARALFQGDSGGFMVNWPYVWASWQAEVEGGTLDKSVLEDIGWTTYPEVSEGTDSAPPFGGIHIGIGAFSDQPELALEAVECITSEENQVEYMVTNGNPAALKSAYEDKEVRKAYPTADAILNSLEQAAPRPLTPYYSEVSASLQRVFHPPTSVTSSTPAEAATLIKGVINGEVLL